MTVQELFMELDALILRNWCDLQASLETEQGKSLIKQLASKENAAELRERYRSCESMNSLACELKVIIEREQSKTE